MNKWLPTIAFSVLLLVPLAEAHVPESSEPKTSDGKKIAHEHPKENYNDKQKENLKKIVKDDFGFKDSDFTDNATSKYNCHGFTVGNGSGVISRAEVQRVLDTDWMKLPGGKAAMAMIGDIVVYNDGGLVTHTGKVIAVDPKTGNVTKVESKWGDMPRVEHDPNTVPDRRQYDNTPNTWGGYGMWDVYRMKVAENKVIKENLLLDINQNKINVDSEIQDVLPNILPPGLCGEETFDDVIGGGALPIEQTSLILAGAQSFSWMIPVILSGIGIGFVLVKRIL